MQVLKQLLQNKVFKIDGSKNIRWEKLADFARYVGIDPTQHNIVILLRLAKSYGLERVLALKSDLKDNSFDRKDFVKYLTYKLKTPPEQGQAVLRGGTGTTGRVTHEPSILPHGKRKPPIR